MNTQNKSNVDIIIIGGGIAGLYSAYKIRKLFPEKSFLLLEKDKKKYLAGRMGNDKFHGVNVVTGAGIGRKEKDKLLIKLLKDLKMMQEISFFPVNPLYANTIKNKIDIMKLIKILRKKYKKYVIKPKKTFGEFAKNILGKELYNDFLISSGYSDYEKADIYEVLYDYGMEDNKGGWTGISIYWKKLIMLITQKIGEEKIKKSTNVKNIEINSDLNFNSNEYYYKIQTNKKIYYCNKIIVATNINTLREIIPKTKQNMFIYNQIRGQEFLRLYGKFSRESIQIMKNYVTGYTIVPGLLQKIIPINANKGVYMIAYSDNNNAKFLKKYITNTKQNCSFFSKLIEKSLGIPSNSINILSIKEYYWETGTHYFSPLKESEYYNTRNEFIKLAQHPDKNMIVVGECVSKNHGWVEGTLQSVEKTLTEKWINL